MNDNELDEMLGKWDAPTVRAELWEHARARFLSARKREPGRSTFTRWMAGLVPTAGKGLFAGAVAGATVFLFVIASAFPQSLVFGTPSPALRRTFAVQSTVFRYADDGSSSIDATLISYSYKGMEVVLEEFHPGNPILEAIKGFHNGIHFLLLRYVPGIVLPESSAKDAWFSSYVKSGCVDKGDTVLGHEEVLNYSATMVQFTHADHSRSTVWLAPDLGCFPLKIRNEQQTADGTFRLVTERKASKVMGHL